MDARAPARLAVVIPAYDEASTIADIALRAREYVDLVIVVNDGSSDGTARALEGLPVIVLNNTTNLGKGRSLRRGFRFALEQGADSVITLDGDGQHRPEDIPLLLEKAASQSNRIIIAARLRNRHAAPRLRRFANRFADFWISWAAGQQVRDSQSGFRLYPAAALRQCAAGGGGFVFESEILIEAARWGFWSVCVAIDSLYHDKARPSHYRPLSDTLAIVRMVAWKLICRGLYPLGLLRSLGLIKHRKAGMPYLRQEENRGSTC